MKLIDAPLNEFRNLYTPAFRFARGFYVQMPPISRTMTTGIP